MANKLKNTFLSEYRVWQSIRVKCKPTKGNLNNFYVLRGITVCQRWSNSFENFLNDMGPKPSPKHSIDRIDTHGNYEPKNCRWATHAQQCRNTRTNKWIEFKGETLIYADWARKLGLHDSTIFARIKRGWSLEEAISGYRKKGNNMSEINEEREAKDIAKKLTELLTAFMKEHNIISLWGWDDERIILARDESRCTFASIEPIFLTKGAR